MISPIYIENSKLHEMLTDPITMRLMTDAVRLNPCGHVFCEETILNLETPARCPFDRHYITNYCADRNIRDLAQEMQNEVNAQNSRILESSTMAKALSEEDAKILFFESANKGLADQLELFCDRGMGVDTTNEYGWTALIFAASRGHLLAVKILLFKKANPNAVDTFMATALMWAGRNGYHEILIALLDAGAEINAADCDGRTALMFASRAGNVECVVILIEREADVTLEANNGMKAIDLAREKNHDEVVRLLENK